jgi:hypothetical protein
LMPVTEGVREHIERALLIRRISNTKFHTLNLGELRQIASILDEVNPPG